MEFEIGKYYRFEHSKSSDIEIIRCEGCKNIALLVIVMIEISLGKDPRQLMYFGTGVTKRVSTNISKHLGLDYEMKQLVLGHKDCTLPDYWDWQESSEEEFNAMCSEINWEFYNEPYKTEVRDAIEKR